MNEISTEVEVPFTCCKAVIELTPEETDMIRQSGGMIYSSLDDPSFEQRIKFEKER